MYSIIKNLFRYRSTKNHKKYWGGRKIDWEKHYISTINHPHRDIIVKEVEQIDFNSLLEIGCGAGSNVAKINMKLPGKKLFGTDINADAILTAQKNYPSIAFKQSLAETVNIDVDLILSDACLLLYDSKDIKKVLQKLDSKAKLGLILCEQMAGSWYSWLKNWFWSGHNAHNYLKLLKSLGYKSIKLIKLDRNDWDDDYWATQGYIIIALKQ